MGQVEFVTDTNARVFRAAAKRKLSRRAREMFDRVNAGTAIVHVPAAVSMEIWLLTLGNRIKMPSTFSAWWRDAGSEGLVHVPCLHDDIVAASELPWEHRDIYDRLIVVTARRLDLPLLTSDQVIHESGLVDAIW